MKQLETKSALLIPLIILVALFMGCPNGLFDSEDEATYTVTYDGNGSTGGSVPTDSSEYQEGEAVTVLGNTCGLAKTYYSFAGWNTASDGNGTTYLSGAAFAMEAADVTLYAVWSQNTHTLSFSANGGSGTMTAQTIDEGAEIILSANSFTREGHEFIGWSETPEGSVLYEEGTSYTMGAVDAVLYARWNRVSFIVIYDGNGNTGGTAPVDGAYYDTGDTATTMANTGALINAGYIFAGWSLNQDDTEPTYLEGDSVDIAGDVTLYAVWTAVDYSLLDTGPAGGYILYINAAYETDGWKYLEAAPGDQGASIRWGTVGTTTGATETAIGTGRTNTATIVGVLPSLISSNCAAKLCDSYETTADGLSYGDWFLPSKDELGLMYTYASEIGGFTANGYWSSSETGADNANMKNFVDGYWYGSSRKDTLLGVRSARVF